jgi:hypothetical protein
MDSLFLKLPRELRDRIYYFVLGRYANWPGITDDNHFYVIGHSPDAIPFGPTNPESHRMVWGWIFTSKQMFSEARAQSRRDARLVSKNHSMYRPNDDRNYHTGLPNSKQSFSFAEPEQVEDWSIDTRIRQCQSLHRFDQTGHDPSYPVVNRYDASTFVALSSFRASPDCIPGYIKSVAPVLRTLRMHIRLANSLGAELGTNYLTGTLIPESMMLPDVTFEHVELVLFEPSIGSDFGDRQCSPTQRTDTHDLQGVMYTYAMLQRELEAAAIALVGPTKDEGILIRDRIAQGSDRRLISPPCKRLVYSPRIRNLLHTSTHNTSQPASPATRSASSNNLDRLLSLFSMYSVRSTSLTPC